MRKPVYPLTFEPAFRDYIWGGRNLETRFGRKLPPGIVAESWEISGHNSSSTRVEQGAWAGYTLEQVLHELGTELVGCRSFDMLRRGKFPLLVKLLDACQDLSVQVHPDDAYAQEHEQGELGKAEFWYVLYAEPGAQLIYGLAEGVTKESFRAACQSGALDSQLYYVDMAAGDCFFVPAGTIHALLAGAVVAEVQQSSDTTYRVHDWGRVDDAGYRRELHVEKALDVINWRQITPRKADPVLLQQDGGMTRSQLIACPQFVVEEIHLDPRAHFSACCDGATFEIWGCMTGAGTIVWPDGELHCEAVRWALLPAALGEYIVQATEPSTWLRIYIGD